MKMTRKNVKFFVMSTDTVIQQKKINRNFDFNFYKRVDDKKKGLGISAIMVFYYVFVF